MNGKKLGIILIQVNENLTIIVDWFRGTDHTKYKVQVKESQTAGAIKLLKFTGSQVSLGCQTLSYK